jgi:hypothetical protein
LFEKECCYVPFNYYGKHKNARKNLHFTGIAQLIMIIGGAAGSRTPLITK